MGRFVNPKSARRGYDVDWSHLAETPGGYLKVKGFVDYIENLILFEEGFILDKVSVDNKLSSVEVSLVIYDRFLEIGFQYPESRKKELDGFVEDAVGGRCLMLKRLILSEGFKYFGKPVDLSIYFVNQESLSAEGLSKYISYNLTRGISLVEIIRQVSMQLKGRSVESAVDESYGLSHRTPGVYSKGIKTFSKRVINGRTLLGYRVDIAGRFSRKQRASKRSIYEGKVPLGSFKGFLDYGYSKSIMDYGVSSVRVWCYFDRRRSVPAYLCKIK